MGGSGQLPGIQAMKKTSTTPQKAKASKTKVEKQPHVVAQADLFPIVGLGASAGGFEALELFLKHIPPNSGMAFVIVQHLDPTRKCAMAELLQRCTSMKVAQAKDRMRVRPDSVFVIPPNKDMSILHGVLHLFEPKEIRGLRLPIDFFLRSLALDMNRQSIAVILSGMGSDGTLGVREIKEKAGLVLVQDPQTAKFDSMPRNVIDAGLADIVAPVEELPGRILSYLKRVPVTLGSDIQPDGKTEGALEKILILLRARTTHDFSCYKKSTLYRRIERRMGIHQIDKIEAYGRFLRENPHEIDLLFKEFLIGVTSFFRDPAAWQILRDEVVPKLLSTRKGGPIRAWVAGCSTGEEAYSLAILFMEVMETMKLKKNFKLQIFATDLDSDAIDRARQGVFPESIAAHMAPEHLDRFFNKEEHTYRLRGEIRESVIFSKHSIIMDPPFTRLDFVSCRNLLIYLTPEMQEKLLPLFHYSLNPGGILFLGNAESIGHFSALFAAVNGKSRIFRRTESAMKPDSIAFPSSFGSLPPAGQGSLSVPKQHASLQNLAEQLVIQRYSPPTVLVNPEGDILHISGRTGKYLEPAAGKANWNVFAMAREGLRYELAAAFQKAVRQDGPIILRGLKVDTNGGQQFVDITLEKLGEGDPLAGMVIVIFTDTATPTEGGKSGTAAKVSPRSRRLADVEKELHRARRELQGTRDEMQSSREELRSANEEMQSTNEEMQSTNEELTTSKEEMQSLNEELQTVNAELQGKVDELSRSNNDMKNLLNSTDVATLFLDNELKVRRFTTQATKIIQLIPGDIGRPITDLASSLLYPDLPEDAREVLRKLGFSEKAINTKDGRWFTVRIMPYRTLDDRIDGVVITFWDISVAKTLEAKLQAMQGALESRLSEQSAILDITRVELKAERKRRGKDGGKSPKA